MIELWFLRPMEDCVFSYMVNLAIEKTGDFSNITHVVIKPTENVLFDVTIDGISLADDFTDYTSRLSAVVRLKFENHSLMTLKIMNRMERMVKENETLNPESFINWFAIGKSDGKFCTDYILELLGISDEIEKNTLPSELLEWFDNEDVQNKLKEEYDIEEIKVERISNNNDS